MKNIHDKLMEKGGWYATFHQHSKAQLFQWLILGVVVLGLGFLIYQRVTLDDGKTNGLSTQAALERTPNGGPDLAPLPELTRNLLNLVQQYRKASVEDRPGMLAELRSLAKSRSELMQSAIQRDPRVALNNGINVSLNARVPEEVKSLVESRRTVKGKFEYIHVHYGEFDNGEAEDFYYVKENSGKRYQIYIPEDDVEALTDDTVEVTGVVLNDKIASTKGAVKIVSSANKSKSAALPHSHESWTSSLAEALHTKTHEADAQTLPVNVRKAAAFIINFPTHSNTLSTSTVRAGIFDTADNYYRENSFGKWGFVGKNTEDGSSDVFTVSISFDGATCDTSTISSQAKSAAAAQGIDLTGYNNLLYFFPSVSSCGWSGLASIGGTQGYVYMNGNAASGVIIHELGHNMGTQHASSWSCTQNGVRVSVSSDANCTLGEYGDPYDVMGQSGGQRHMSNYHKGITLYSMNWLSSTNTQTLSRGSQPDGTYTIYPIEDVTTGVQSLRIPRTVSSTGVVSDYYYVQATKAFGFDSSISTLAQNGVTIRIAPNYTSTDKSKLVDTTPATTSFSDAPLAIGQTFVDPFNAINITTLSAGPTGAQVRVSFGALPCTNVAPTVTMTPATQTGAPGQTLTYSVTVKNNDTVSCAASAFTVSPTLPAGFVQSPPTLTTNAIDAGQSQTIMVNVTAPDAVAASNYTLTERAQNTTNASLTATASAVFSVLVPDTAPPTVTITSPVNGTTIPSKGNFAISANATDDRGVSRIDILFDTKIIKSCSAVTACSANYQINKVPAGAHTITAKAVDQAGNSKTATVSVTK